MTIILHHYPQSPMAEKVRVAFGIKGMNWSSVEVPRIPPKPKLFPLTGGYRRVPVMQVGADIYCDTLCILQSLDGLSDGGNKLCPEATDHLGWALSRWIDGALFKDCLTIILGHQADTLPADFAKDRGRLYFGPEFDLGALQRALPEASADVRASLAMLSDACHDPGPFVTGSRAGLLDVYVYYILWFLRGRWDRGPDFLDQFPKLLRLEKAISALGHGTATAMSEDDALAIARENTPIVEPVIEAPEPQGLNIGQRVSIQPIGDGGDPKVTGNLARLTAHEAVIIRHESEFDLGELALHFPRAGYRIRAA